MKTSRPGVLTAAAILLGLISLSSFATPLLDGPPLPVKVLAVVTGLIGLLAAYGLCGETQTEGDPSLSASCSRSHEPTHQIEERKKNMVKKISQVCGIVLALFVLAGAGVVVFPKTSAHAAENEVVVFHTCSDLTTDTDTSFTSTVGGFTFSYCFKALTPSSNATASFHGTLVDRSTAPARATIVRGFPVIIPPNPVLFTDTQLVVTPSGEVNGILAHPPDPI